VGAAWSVPEREQRELAAWSKSVEVLVARQVRSRAGCAGETLVRHERRRTARSEQWRAGRIQTCEQQRDAGQGRARFGRAR
jgi:hypothetical protein